MSQPTTYFHGVSPPLAHLPFDPNWGSIEDRRNQAIEANGGRAFAGPILCEEQKRIILAWYPVTEFPEENFNICPSEEPCPLKAIEIFEKLEFVNSIPRVYDEYATNHGAEIEEEIGRWVQKYSERPLFMYAQLKVDLMLPYETNFARVRDDEIALKMAKVIMNSYITGNSKHSISLSSIINCSNQDWLNQKLAKYFQYCITNRAEAAASLRSIDKAARTMSVPPFKKTNAIKNLGDSVRKHRCNKKKVHKKFKSSKTPPLTLNIDLPPLIIDAENSSSPMCRKMTEEENAVYWNEDGILHLVAAMAYESFEPLTAPEFNTSFDWEPLDDID